MPQVWLRITCDHPHVPRHHRTPRPRRFRSNSFFQSAQHYWESASSLTNVYLSPPRTAAPGGQGPCLSGVPSTCCRCPVDSMGSTVGSPRSQALRIGESLPKPGAGVPPSPAGSAQAADPPDFRDKGAGSTARSSSRFYCDQNPWSCGRGRGGGAFGHGGHHASRPGQDPKGLCPASSLPPRQGIRGAEAEGRWEGSQFPQSLHPVGLREGGAGGRGGSGGPACSGPAGPSPARVLVGLMGTQ